LTSLFYSISQNLLLLKRKMNCGCHFWKLPAFQKILCMLQDIEATAKNLQFREHLLLHPEILNLETLYWAKVEESIPKWEPFFLGRTQAPIVTLISNMNNTVQDVHCLVTHLR
uniref:Uncharacterized protein n=1 Tax=Laticauda laticaudata TaxID=8630 RepID=A0A8C5T1E4_LATLA